MFPNPYLTELLVKEQIKDRLRQAEKARTAGDARRIK